jgi:hypothetical protein
LLVARWLIQQGVWQGQLVHGLRRLLLRQLYLGLQGWSVLRLSWPELSLLGIVAQQQQQQQCQWQW